MSGRAAGAGRERDFVGYGRFPPKVEWPYGARVVINIVVNYEEGAERSVPDGDPRSEAFGDIARYFTAPGFGHADDFYQYLVASFEQLCEEGARTPRLMSIGLHCRISGRPGRAAAIDKFLTHVVGRDGVWLARRDEIARYWLERYPGEQMGGPR